VAGRPWRADRASQRTQLQPRGRPHRARSRLAPWARPTTVTASPTGRTAARAHAGSGRDGDGRTRRYGPPGQHCRDRRRPSVGGVLVRLAQPDLRRGQERRHDGRATTLRRRRRSAQVGGVAPVDRGDFNRPARTGDRPAHVDAVHLTVRSADLHSYPQSCSAPRPERPRPGRSRATPAHVQDRGVPDFSMQLGVTVKELAQSDLEDVQKSPTGSRAGRAAADSGR
jgi:hypothetical protein